MEIDITLPQQAYAIFESLKYTEYNAIGEFIDNSIQSYLNNSERLKKLEKKFKLKIDLILTPNRLEVIDNSSGIDHDNLKRGLKPATKPEISNGLSEFGMGLKTASFFLCRKWSLITKHFDSNEEFRVDFDNVAIYTKAIKKVSVYPTTVKNKTHYTKLILENLIFDTTDQRKIGELKENLSSMYRHYLRDDEIEIFINGDKLKFEKYDFLKAKKLYGDEKEIIWKKEINFTLESGRKVTGFAGLLKTGNPTESGFTYLRRNRVIEGLIEGVKIIDIQSTANTQLSRRLFAELNLDNFRVSHTKDAILFGNERFEFEAKLKEALDDGDIKLIYQGRRFTVKTPFSKNIPISNQTKSEERIQEAVKKKTFEVSMSFHDEEVNLNGEINRIALEMKDSYEHMYKVENILRALIKVIENKENVSFLEENNYQLVENKKEIRKIRSKIDWLKAEEIKEGTVTIRGNNDLFYTGFDSLKTIIELNFEKYFYKFFVRKSDVLGVLDRLYAYRNNIAHNSYLSKEERNYIEWALNIFFVRQLEGKVDLSKH